MLMNSLTELKRSRKLIRFGIQKSNSEGVLNLSDDKVPVFIVIKTLVLNLAASYQQTTRNIRQFAEENMESIVFTWVLRKFYISLSVNFLQSCFLFAHSFDFESFLFAGFSFIVLRKCRLKRLRVEYISDLIKKPSNLAKIFFFESIDLSGEKGHLIQFFGLQNPTEINQPFSLHQILLIKFNSGNGNKHHIKLQ